MSDRRIDRFWNEEDRIDREGGSAEGPLRLKLLHRQRMHRLFQSILEVPLFVVMAAIGYGKTTAMKQFLDRENLTYSWLTLSRGEKDPAWTWQKLCQSLEAVNADLAAYLSRLGLPKTALDRDRMVSIVAQNVSKPTVVVIDDYQENKSQHVDKALTALADAQIPHFHLAILSRVTPKIPLSELRLKTLCVVVSQEDLAFNQTETLELARINGNMLSEKEERWLLNQTDGWAAAICLSLIQYRHSKKMDSDQSIHQLLKESVYDRLDEQTKDILLAVSLADRFTLEEAAYVTKNPQAGHRICMVAEENGFMECDRKTGSYAIQGMFKKVLQDLLYSSCLDQRALLSRFGDWHAQRDNRIQAIEFYHRARDHEGILSVFERFGSSELIDRAPATIVEAFEGMTKEQKLANPIAYIAYICSYTLTQDPIAGARMLYEAKEVYGEDDTLADRAQIMGEIAIAEGFLHYNDAGMMAKFHKVAYDLFEGGSSLIANPEASFTFYSPHSLLLYHRKPGELLDLVHTIEENNWYRHIANGCGTGFECVARGEYCLETGDLANAELWLHKGMATARAGGQLSLVICATLSLGRIAVLQNRPHDASALMAATRKEVEATGNPVLLHNLDVAQGYIHSILGNLDGVPHWLRQDQWTANELRGHGMISRYLVSGRIAMLCRDYQKLGAIAEILKQASSQPHTFIFGLVHAGIFDAIAKSRLIGLDVARKELLTAVDLATADQLILPFVENILELRDLLLEGISTAWDDWMSKVLALGEAWLQGNSRLLSKSLTQRELEVLALLSKGLTQKEMASKLHLSHNTIRRHLQNVYRKLNVNNKTMAIARAQELGLFFLAADK